MEWFEALILGLIQGLTEFLPVSSSGHLELGKVLLDVETKDNATFSILVHGATLLSIIVVFAKDLGKLARESIRFQWNQETQYLIKILISMIPVGIIGLFLEDQVRALFSGNIILVGSMLLVTAALLFSTYITKRGYRKINFQDAFIIGIAQAAAVIPGISRSGATIATSLNMGNDRKEAARFSFLMVLVPILAANILDLADLSAKTARAEISMAALVTGFLAAFVSGLLACKWMIRLVQRGKLTWFALYCSVIGIASLIAGSIEYGNV